MKLCSVGALALLFLGACSVFGDSFNQTNLVSDMSGVAANTDPNLKDAWGMSFSSGTPIWVSDRDTGVSTLYTPGTGAPKSLVVSVPPGAPNGPTGQVFAGGSTFMANGGPAFFIFDTLGGTVDAWGGKSGTTAQVVVPASGARYEGLAMANNMLFAANFSSGGGIDVYNSSYSPVSMSGKFTDPNLPAGYAPFDIQLVNGFLYVTYAKLSSSAPVPLPGGGGYVDQYDTSGNLVARVISNGALNAPWGITMAPKGFGSLGGDLLVGNFGNGEINAYTTSGTWVETLSDSKGNPISINGLWSLDFDSGAPNPDALYFTAGPNNGNDGLFGDISTPEPSAVGMAMFGVLGLLGFFCARSRKTKAA